MGNVKLPSSADDFKISALFFQPLTETRSFMQCKAVSAIEYLRENCPVPSNVTVKGLAQAPLHRTF
jgi:hypothetical protein